MYGNSQHIWANILYFSIDKTKCVIYGIDIVNFKNTCKIKRYTIEVLLHCYYLKLIPCKHLFILKFFYIRKNMAKLKNTCKNIDKITTVLINIKILKYKFVF